MDEMINHVGQGTHVVNHFYKVVIVYKDKGPVV